MRRLICCITLLTFIIVNPPAGIESRPALRFAGPGGTVSATVQQNIVPLPFDTPVSGSVPPRQGDVCMLGPTQYMVQYPGGATRIKIEVISPSHPVFQIRFGQPVAVENGQIIGDFIGGFGSSFYFPVAGPHLFEAGTYFIGLSNCTLANADYTFQVRLLRPTDAETAEVTGETSFGEILAAAPGSCSLGQTQYRVTTPPTSPCVGGTLFNVFAQSNQNINLYIRRDQRVAVEDGRIVADMTTTAPRGSQFISLPSGGTFFIAVGNCSTATADYVISLNQAIIDPPPPDLPLIIGCQLMRNPNGSYVLDVFGTNIRAGATVTVGGVAPKKIRFIELVPGTTDRYQTIRLVKKFCGSLPGNIVVTNPPGTCGSSPSGGFFCNRACAN
ncbi:MAG TPA: hypothetical protein VKA60_00615 [Blastocatellia bacterium]|nr:hypothetical protein [Blastocatellia bacterium]